MHLLSAITDLVPVWHSHPSRYDDTHLRITFRHDEPLKSYQQWIWQRPEWPSLVFDAQRIQTLLAHAKNPKDVFLEKPK